MKGSTYSFALQVATWKPHCPKFGHNHDFHNQCALQFCEQFAFSYKRALTLFQVLSVPMCPDIPVRFLTFSNLNSLQKLECPPLPRMNELLQLPALRALTIRMERDASQRLVNRVRASVRDTADFLSRTKQVTMRQERPGLEAETVAFAVFDDGATHWFARICPKKSRDHWLHSGRNVLCTDEKIREGWALTDTGH